MMKTKGGRIISILTSLSLVILGLFFIICTAHLFFTGGETPYTGGRVGEYLTYLAFPSIITVCLIIAGFVYSIAKGVKEDHKTPRSDGELLESFLLRYDQKSFDKDTMAQVSAIRKRRNIIDLTASLISSCCFVFIIDYVLFIADFTVENLNKDVTSTFALTLPIGLFAIAIHLVRAYLSERSAKEELSLLKASVKEHGAEKASPEKPTKKKINSILVGRVALISVALLFIVLGAINGGMKDVLEKAIRICTECIGLG